MEPETISKLFNYGMGLLTGWLLAYAYYDSRLDKWIKDLERTVDEVMGKRVEENRKKWRR